MLGSLCPGGSLGVARGRGEWSQDIVLEFVRLGVLLHSASGFANGTRRSRSSKKKKVDRYRGVAYFVIWG